MRKIVVLDGREIPHPEDLAMVQAMYSRSPASIDVHLEKVRKVGSGRFMEQFYANYGHKSIGDCGLTSMFIEQVSILAAKAIQDTPLYSGQEASTRYLDMAAQEVLNPLNETAGRAIQDAWMTIYSTALMELIPRLGEQYPRREDEKQNIWEKAIKARAFDIARSLLPAGVTTLVAWTANLRQANDHLKEMRHHPLEEIRAIADELHQKLTERCPSSFIHKRYEADELYAKQSMESFAFYDGPVRGFSFENKLDLQGLERHRKLLTARPPKSELHQRLRRFGSIDFEFPIDFGSYRDLQRQRSAVQEMPLLTTKHGFHPWYLEHLPTSTVGRIEDLRGEVENLQCDPYIRQYYIPLGFLVPVVMSCTLPSAVYIAELRSGDTVHPTLRTVAQAMGDAIEQCVPGIAMHHDKSPGIWNIKRGNQDIVVVAPVA